MGIYNKNIRDESLKATVALPAADGSVTSDDIDLGGDLVAAHGLVEVLVTVPALTVGELPAGDTLDIVLQNGASAAPTTALHTFAQLSGSAQGLAETELRCALPSSTKRYLNAKITAAGSVADLSGKDVVLEVLT